MISESMQAAFPPKPAVRDVVEIIKGPHAGMIGRVRNITNGRARIVFSSTARSVLVVCQLLEGEPMSKEYERIGGGCGLCSSFGDYPCDDEYEHIDTGERFTVRSTQERHFNMPQFVDGPSDLYQLSGVQPEWGVNSEAWKDVESP